MKKKLLMFALPALMALSGCSGVSTSPKANNLMAEDTLAHEEIFGEAVEAGELGVKKLGPHRAVSFDEDFVKIGYQINYDSTNDKLAIRFVAAIKDSGVVAYWHRGFAQPNSSEGAEVATDVWKYKMSDNVVDLNVQSTKIYSTLTDGGTPITAGYDEYVGYTGFVIYTLKNIPYTAYKDSYFGAYLDLRDADTPEVTGAKSKFYAVKIEKEDAYTSKNTFSFDVDAFNNKHFLQGKINGNADTLYLEDGDTLDSGNNFASYKDISLKAGDYFGSFYFKKDSNFIFCGYDDFYTQSTDLFNESTKLSGYSTPVNAGTHTLFISKGDGKKNWVYSAWDDENETFTVTGLQDWTGGVPLFASVKHQNNEWYWVSASWDGTNLTFSAPKNIKTFLAVRCSAGTTVPSWSVGGDDAGRIYNKLNDITVVAGTFSYGSSWVDYYPS